jgi:hypothetical protein
MAKYYDKSALPSVKNGTLLPIVSNTISGVGEKAMN